MAIKTGSKVVSLDAATKEAHQQRIAFISRVNRPNIVKFFLNKNGFASLPEYTQAQVKSREYRIINKPKGWTVPTADFGRVLNKGQDAIIVTEPVKESIRQWVTKFCMPIVQDWINLGVLPEGTQVGVTLEEWHSDGPRVVIYRKRF